MWLKAPVVEEGEDGKNRYNGYDKGTLQGGVLSPLLANIYLNVLDTLQKVKKVRDMLGTRLVRYADDFVGRYPYEPSWKSASKNWFECKFERAQHHSVTNGRDSQQRILATKKLQRLNIPGPSFSESKR